MDGDAKELTREEIAQGLRRVGLRAGDKVMVHSSLKSFGRVAGGPAGVIAALQDVLTPSGTLMMPSFNHAGPWKEGAAACYDPEQTPTCNGAIPDAFWRTSGVFRSLDPTHPIACWGADAERYTKFHHRTLTMGADSPLGLLGREGGKVLMLGVGYKPNTYHHVIEMTVGVPCLGLRTEQYPVRLPGGRIVMARTWGWRQRACPITDKNLYPKLMAPYESRGAIGRCEALMFSCADCFRVVSKVLAEGVGEDAPPCSRCPIRPRVNAFTVESDWDAGKGCPQSDSVAWTY